LAQSDESFASLAPYVAPLVDYDPAQHALTTEMLPDAENLNVYHARTNRFDASIGSALGKALGAVHRAQAAQETSSPVFTGIRPWVLTIAQTAESVFTNMTPSTRELVGMLRRNAVLVYGLYSLDANWRRETLIHGDVKWDNFLRLTHTGNAAADWDLRIVDWELADIGDSGWDMGCALCCYVQHWLATLSADGSREDIAVLAGKAPIRIEAIWPALRALWRSYSEERRFSPQQDYVEVRRAAAFAAGRLVLTAFEMSMRSPAVPRTAVLCLQLATAMLGAPEIGMYEILGLTRQEAIN